MPEVKKTKRPAGQPKKTQELPARRGGVKQYQAPNTYKAPQINVAEMKREVAQKNRKTYTGAQLSNAVVLAVSLTVNVALAIALLV